MTIRLVDWGWGEEINEVLTAYPGELRTVCPFLKWGSV